MLHDHPSVEEFQSFLRNIPRPNNAARNVRVLRHLLADCSTCRDRLQSMGWQPERLERLVYLAGNPSESVLQAAEGYNYDRAFAKADEAVSKFLVAAPLPQVPAEELLAELDLHPLAEQVSLVERDERFSSPSLIQWLIDRSHAKRYADPDEMLHWSRLARSVAAHATPEAAGGEEKLSDLQARAVGQFGNALRVAGRMREAEEALSTAQHHLEMGTGDPALRAKLFEQVASLHTFQRRFDAAISALTEATEIYRSLGESHALARTLVLEAIAKLYSGEPEGAVVILNQAIPLIDQEGDPHLLFAACHNLVQCYINLDRPELALSIYSEMSDLYKDFSDPLLLLRTAWQEGHLLRDLGHLQAAEAALLRARTGFLKMDLMYEAAVVSLDLAAVYVKLGAVESCKQTAAETVPIFRALGVVRETLASLLQLQRVADQEQQALEIIRLLNARIEPHAKRNLLK